MISRISYPRLCWLMMLIIGLSLSIIRISNWSERKVIDWDISHYYSYLPATFIYHDYNFNDSAEAWTEAHFRLIPIDKGGRTAKMTSGVAILASPFFLLAHALTSYSTDIPANGFSRYYQWSMVFAALFYALLGLWYLARWLSFLFDDLIVTMVISAIFLGTNLLYYSTFEPMSHAFSFGLINLAFYHSFLYARTPSLRSVITVGISAGLLVLIRPTNLILLLFPLIYLTGNRNAQNRGRMIKDILLVLALLVIVQLPQVLYWKSMTGHWFVYSYPGEGFFFGDPKIWQGLFGYRKGWFVYSPVLLLALPGFYWLFTWKRKLFYAVTPVVLLGVWITFSWWCWWYGGSFGARALIEYLPIMAIPLGITFQKIVKARPALKLTGLTIILVFVFWSTFLTNQYVFTRVHHDGMTKKSYWAQLKYRKEKAKIKQYLDHPDYDEARRGNR